MREASAPVLERHVSSVSFISDEHLKEEYERLGAWGLLASIDLHGCERELITSPADMRRFVVELCKRIHMTRHGDTLIERFGEGDLEGYSMFQFIETSSISAHFDEKLGDNAYIDIFSCKYFDPGTAAEFAKEFFKARDYNLTYILRK